MSSSRMTPPPDREDQVAIAHYLGTLRSSGPTLEPRLIDAFERLTPRQLDTLIESTLESREQEQPVDEPTANPPQRAETPSEPKPRRWFRRWTSDDWTWFWILLAAE